MKVSEAERSAILARFPQYARHADVYERHVEQGVTFAHMGRETGLTRERMRQLAQRWENVVAAWWRTQENGDATTGHHA